MAEKPTLFLEFHGANDSEVENQTLTVQELCLAHNGGEFKSAQGTEEMHRLWKARHSVR